MYKLEYSVKTTLWVWDDIEKVRKPIIRANTMEVPLQKLAMPLQTLLREASHLLKEDLLWYKVWREDTLIGYVYKRKGYITIESFEAIK
jgi:hypothetical protein